MNAERRQTLIVDYGAEILGEFWLTNSMYVKMPVEDVKRYAQEQQHHYILLHPGYEEGGVWGSQDPSVARQAIDSDWLYNAQSSLNNTHECIAVIDTGVRKTHTLFNSPNRINRTVDCIYGGPSCTDTTVNPTLYDSDDDCLSHGTAVASVISANSNDGDSLHGISTACINSYKVFQTIHSSGSSTCTTYLNSAWVVTAIQAALANGDRIINLSLYTNCLNQSLCDVTHAVDAAYDLGAIIFVASARCSLFLNQNIYSVGSQPYSVAVADVNNDDKPDIVTANADSNTTSVLLNRGNGIFFSQVTFLVGAYPWSLAVADVNSDNKSDIVTANYHSRSVSVLLNTGNGTFSSEVPYLVGTGPQSVVVADVNNDNKPDIVTANTGTNTISVLLNRGNGTFFSQTTYEAGLQPSSVAVADVNNDNKPDIIVANYDANTVGVLLHC
ncbi:unnamed protein product [Adineta steineri]|uniref:Peptidase S8/S53 domain-containing protein n=1 Tax=Adineta steineri TaxID=433720 RepID=A0A815PKY2_9BILA|nr:unnamed protein product [Adineta steineri]